MRNLSLTLILGLGLLQGCCAVGLFREKGGEPAPKAVKKAGPEDAKAKELSKVAETVKTDGGLLVKLKGDVLFEKGKDTLNPAAATIIADLAKALKKDRGDRFEVLGHTDSTGKDEDNLKLSQTRAEAVMAELVKNGIARSKVTAKGMGETQPIASNATVEGRAKNRRAEIKIIE